MEVQVTKRNGELEQFNAEKINKVLEWSCEDLNGVSASSIAVNAELMIEDKIKTSDIHDILITSASNLISEDEPNYSKVAARLLNYKLRKGVWGGFNPPRLIDHIRHLVTNNRYDESILEYYSEADINKINEFIHHDRDDMFEYAGLKQLCEKYIVKDNRTGQMFETPQFIYILVAMTLFREYTPTKRFTYVKRAYNYFSKHKINLPTPVMGGVRTKTKSGASCCLIEVDDDLKSISATMQACMHATSDKYGMGIDISKIRSVGSSVRNGETSHTGIIPFIRTIQDSIKSCMQGAARRGSGTVTCTIFHPEILDFVQLRDNGAVEEKRIPHLDYLVTTSKLFLERYLNDEYITLMDYKDAPEVYNAFGMPNFDEVYLKYEKKKFPSKKKVKASEVFNMLIKQRQETGRIYILFLDHANEYSPWNEKVSMSNLCVSGDQRIPTNLGLLTAEELYDLNHPFETFDNQTVVQSSEMKLIEKDAKVYEITLQNGMSHKITDYHKVVVATKDNRGRDKESNVKCKNLKINNRIAIQTNKGIFGNRHMTKEAFLLGLYQSDGTQHKDIIMLDVWENDFDLLNEIQESFNYVHNKYGIINNKKDNIPAKFHNCTTGQSKVKKKRLASKTLHKALNFQKGFVPHWVWESNEETQWPYVRGLLYADGSVTMGKSKGNPIQISYVDINLDFLKDLQILTRNLGLQSSIKVAREEGHNKLPDGKGGSKLYLCKKSWRLLIGNKNDALIVEKNTGFLSRKNIELEDREYRNNTKKYDKIKSIKYIGKEDVYCCTINSDNHHFVCNGVITHNCVEILHAISPIYSLDDPNGEIGICILAATNMLNITSDFEHEKVCDVIVRMLDELIDYQHYFAKPAEKFAKEKRSLGVGVINYAAWLAKQGIFYEDLEAPRVTSKFFEKQQYYLMKASNQLAKEKGPCLYSDRSKYTHFVLPNTSYKADLDEFVDEPEMDWSSLGKDLQEFGIRNSTLSCIMPCEASGKTSGATSGIEPPLSPITYMKSKSTTIPCVIPNMSNKNKYTYAFGMKNNLGYIRCAASIQRWLCMGMSTNLYYDPAKYEDKLIPRQEIVQDLLTCYKYGIKSLYYMNTNDGDVQYEEEKGCDGGGCAI